MRILLQDVWSVVWCRDRYGFVCQIDGARSISSSFEWSKCMCYWHQPSLSCMLWSGTAIQAYWYNLHSTVDGPLHWPVKIVTHAQVWYSWFWHTVLSLERSSPASSKQSGILHYPLQCSLFLNCRALTLLFTCSETAIRQDTAWWCTNGSERWSKWHARCDTPVYMMHSPMYSSFHDYEIMSRKCHLLIPKEDLQNAGYTFACSTE